MSQDESALNIELLYNNQYLINFSNKNTNIAYSLINKNHAENKSAYSSSLFACFFT